MGAVTVTIFWVETALGTVGFDSAFAEQAAAKAKPEALRGSSCF